MYIITGATGHTGKRIAEALLNAGKNVTAIARDSEKLAPLHEKGASVVATDLTNTEALTEAFRGATAVYLMIPPIWVTDDWRASMREYIKAYEKAVRDSGVKKVVLLSSIGAHRSEGNGPVGGLGELENVFKAIPGIDVLALRPGYFMENLYGSTGMIEHLGFNGGVQKSDLKISIVHTKDIAEVAIKRLLGLDFSGFSHEFISGPADLTFGEITGIIGNAIGKPDLKYVEFTPADGKAGMVQAGLHEQIANGYVEMAGAMNRGEFQEGYQRSAAHQGATSVEWFVENELKHAFGKSH